MGPWSYVSSSSRRSNLGRILFGEKTPAFDDDIWELYDMSKDWNQTSDLSKRMPGKLHELQRLWLIEATRYDVLPLDDDLGKRMNPDTAGRRR